MPKLYTRNTWQDEVLAGAEAYNISGSAVNYSNVRIDLSTGMNVTGTLVNATRMNNIENGIDTLDNALISGSFQTTWFDGHYQPSGTSPSWNPVGATLTFVSSDSPSFVVTANANVTGSFGVGAKMQLGHLNTTKYFIVTQVNGVTGSITYLNLYGGTDFTLTTGTISNPYYSNSKTPIGFNPNPAKWTQEFTTTQDMNKASPVQNTWYNASGSLSIPIGAWDVEYHLMLYGNDNSGTATAYGTLSTANNSESDSDLTTFVADVIGGSTSISIYSSVTKRKTILLTSKTTYFVNVKTDQATQDAVGTNSSGSKMIIRARCAYL